MYYKFWICDMYSVSFTYFDVVKSVDRGVCTQMGGGLLVQIPSPLISKIYGFQFF